MTRKMDNDPEINAPLDTIAEFGTQQEQSQQTLPINSKSKPQDAENTILIKKFKLHGVN